MALPGYTRVQVGMKTDGEESQGGGVGRGFACSGCALDRMSFLVSAWWTWKVCGEQARGAGSLSWGWGWKEKADPALRRRAFCVRSPELIKTEEREKPEQHKLRRWEREVIVRTQGPSLPFSLSSWPSLCPPAAGTAGKFALAVYDQGN